MAAIDPTEQHIIGCPDDCTDGVRASGYPCRCACHTDNETGDALRKD